MDNKKQRDINFISDLTLGLVETLNAVPGVQDVQVSVKSGTERGGVTSWEQRHNVTLPTTLRSLYNATDGFKLTWNYALAGKLLPLGNMEMHPLSKVARLGSGKGSGDPLAPSVTDLALADDTAGPLDTVQKRPLSSGGQKSKSYSPPAFHISKLFELDNCQGYGRVVIAYPGRGENFPEASFWFLDMSLRPHFLAADGQTYWRLMLAHLGMPQWQALLAGLGHTPWARQWYEVVAPYLLDGPRAPRQSQPQDNLNALDSGIFKNKKNNKNKGTKEGGTTGKGKDAPGKDGGKSGKDSGKDGPAKDGKGRDGKDTKDSRIRDMKDMTKDSKTSGKVDSRTRDQK